MLLARVIGTVVASRKEEELSGLRFLLLKACDLSGKPDGNTVVGVDAVGAGIGDVVLYCSGSAARQTIVTKDRPVDTVVMAIVDIVSEEGKDHYHKGSESEADL